MAVAIKDGVLSIRGREVFLFGGEVQYFRVRDKGFHSARTYDIWAETLDKIRESGMNLVTTYVPWDYHESSRDDFDFEGARDLDRFLSLCCERQLHVQVKPGPYITAEWPHGPGTFGAAPMWLKKEHPETLVRTHSGKIFSFHPLGLKVARQCSYLHPTYLERVKRWYEAVAPIFMRYIHERPCVWSVQIDNETNLFWSDRYHVDYNPVAIRHYRQFLKKHYKDIGLLNERYRSRYNSFDEVDPPRKSPRTGFYSAAERNPVHIDWYEAGWEYIKDYLQVLREMLEGTGIREPDILFTTNDTPALIPVLGRKLLFWRGDMKNRAGLSTLDSYPRWSLNRQLDDIPYQTDSFARLMDFHGDAYPLKNGPWVMGAEMQGGIFGPPAGGIKVRPEATARQVTRAIGAGVKAYAVYVLRQGYNLNNSTYHFQAAIDEKGRPSERLNVLARVAARLVEPHVQALNRAVPIEAPMAVITNSDYQVPLAGARINTIDLWDRSYGGAYGWLKRSGYVAEMADIKNIDEIDPNRWKAILYIDPGLIGAREANMLTKYLEDGGNVIHTGWAADADIAGGASREHKRLLEYLPNHYVIGYHRGTRLTFFAGKERYDFRSRTPVQVWELPSGDARVFLRIPSGGWCGYIMPASKGAMIHISADISRIFNTSYLYRMSEIEMTARCMLARRILDQIGIERPLDWSPLRAEVWARRAPGGRLFLFCLNDGDAAAVHIRTLLPKMMGLEQKENYRVKRIYKDVDMASMTGKKLCEEGFILPMEKWESEVILIES